MRERTPPGLKAAGKRLWSSVADLYELDEHEAARLLEAARTKDLLNELDAAVRRDGVMLDGKVHPAVVEARLQKTSLNQLIASLRLPADDEDGARPQRRGGARQAYGPRK